VLKENQKCKFFKLMTRYAKQSIAGSTELHHGTGRASKRIGTDPVSRVNAFVRSLNSKP